MSTSDIHPPDSQPHVPTEELLQAVAFGRADPDLLSSLASRLARLDRQLGAREREAVAELTNGVTLAQIVARLEDALDPGTQLAGARAAAGLPDDAIPPPADLAAAQQQLLRAATAPLASNPQLREALTQAQQRLEQTTREWLPDAAPPDAARERAKALIASFEQFLEEHRDQIAALRVLHSRPDAQRLRYADLEPFARAIQAPPRAWLPEALWQAYRTLDRSRVRAPGGRVPPDLVSLVRYALHQEDTLAPFAEQVRERFARWLAQQEHLGHQYTAEQVRWLELIRDHVAARLHLESEDLEHPPFSALGGQERAAQLFGNRLVTLLEELNAALAGGSRTHP